MIKSDSKLRDFQMIQHSFNYSLSKNYSFWTLKKSLYKTYSKHFSMEKSRGFLDTLVCLKNVWLLRLILCVSKRAVYRTDIALF
jgi:hypothetical protein